MINKIRQQYPEYDDMTDDQLMSAIYEKYYSDMSPEEFMTKTMRPNHDDLETAAVRGADSMRLQEIAPHLKPMVKMTTKEFSKIPPEKMTNKGAFLINGIAYVIDPQAIDPHDALEAILSGDESEALGYPAPGPNDCAVTKQGDIVTDLSEMKRHADTGNVIWAASGEPDELIDRATNISAAIKNPQPQE